MASVVEDLKGKLGDITAQINTLRDEIVVLERRQASFLDVIRVYEPDFDLLPARPKRTAGSSWNSASNRVTELLKGKNNRHIALDILRRCERPTSTAEIARIFAADIQLGEQLSELETVLASRFSGTLDRLAKQKLVRVAGSLDGRRHLWEICR